MIRQYQAQAARHAEMSGEGAAKRTPARMANSPGGLQPGDSGGSSPELQVAAMLGRPEWFRVFLARHSGWYYNYYISRVRPGQQIVRHFTEAKVHGRKPSSSKAGEQRETGK